jgi:hypothetical protein
MKSAFALPGLVAGTVFFVLAAGCATGESPAGAGTTTRADPPLGSHIVRRPAAPAQSEQEREKTGERTGQAGIAPAQTRP